MHISQHPAKPDILINGILSHDFKTAIAMDLISTISSALFGVPIGESDPVEYALKSLWEFSIEPL